MPLYEYQCAACGHRFEKIQKFSDPLEDKCPVCGGPVHKLISSPAIQFKGSGFYITDYAKKDHVAAEKADSASGEKAAKNEGAGKSDKSEKSDKSDKSDSSAKPDKSASSASTPSSSGSGDSGSSAGSSSKSSDKGGTSKPSTPKAST
jgi:putative FmdB family regulatory protein